MYLTFAKHQALLEINYPHLFCIVWWDTDYYYVHFIDKETKD